LTIGLPLLFIWIAPSCPTQPAAFWGTPQEGHERMDLDGPMVYSCPIYLP
jgi:hypothetical protein